MISCLKAVPRGACAPAPRRDLISEAPPSAAAPPFAGEGEPPAAADDAERMSDSDDDEERLLADDALFLAGAVRCLSSVGRF